MLWKRIKRGLSKTPDEWELELKLPELELLKKKEETGEIDLRYFDESGFSLTPYVPYAWPLIPYKNQDPLDFLAEL